MMARLSFIVASFVLSQVANGALLFTKENSGFNCARIISADYEIIGSPRMTNDRMEEIRGAAEEIFGKEGVLAKLGVSSPRQTIQFMQGSDLNAMSSLNRMPVGHWHDGAQITQTDGSGLIYEIVIPGKTVRHSLFRDDNSFAHQVSILIHVAGHNLFATHNRWRQVRTADLVQESYDLDHYMDQLRFQGVNSDEISRWYQYLLSLTWSQDVINATTVDDVDELKAKASPSTGIVGIKRTPNILQTYIANLSPELPAWKREMARRFEKLQRYIPGAIRTKIMNEGIATFLQEMVVKHTSWATFNYGLQFCCLMSGVIRKGVQNPYWLGLEAYRHLYDRFNRGVFTAEWLSKHGHTSVHAQPKVDGLVSLARDALFMEWVTKNVIEIMDDEQFLWFAFKDGEWLAQQNLTLMRPVRDEEFDRGMGPPPDRENTWQWLIESRDPERVLKSLITQLKGFEFQFPNIEIESLNDENTGMIRLDLSDQVGRQVALQKGSMVKTLYTHALFNNRPVSLESTVEFEHKIYVEFDHNNWWDLEVEWKGTDWVYFRKRMEITRVETRVFPNGTVETYRVLRDGDSSIASLPTSRLFPEKKKITYERMPEFEAALKKVLDEHIENLEIDEPENDGVDVLGRPMRRSTLDKLEEQVSGAIMDRGPSSNMHLAVPTTGKAVDAYDAYVKRRLNRSLKRAIEGKDKVVTRGNSVSIKALPDVPQFGFDRRSMKRAFDEAGRTPRVGLQTFNFTEHFSPDGNGKVIPIGGREGDRRWGPDPRKQDGDGDGDDGDGQPGDKPSDGDPGNGNNGVSWVDVPLEAWARALEDVVELPNLRPKGDKSLTKSEEKTGKVYKRHGELVTRQIIRKAYKRGFQELEEEGEDPFDVFPADVIARGVTKLKDGDFVVRGSTPVKDPEISAQVNFILDLSGSMSGYVEQAKRAFYDLRAILMRRYKNIVFRFITFESSAVVFTNPEEFFRARMGGGTAYIEGLKKDLEVKQQFPPAKYDRFTVMIGDMEDFGGPEFEEVMREVIAQSQYVAALRFNDRQEGFGLGDLLRQLHAEEEFFGYENVSPVAGYTPLAFRRAFKNPEK